MDKNFSRKSSVPWNVCCAVRLVRPHTCHCNLNASMLPLQRLCGACRRRKDEGVEQASTAEVKGQIWPHAASGYALRCSRPLSKSSELGCHVNHDNSYSSQAGVIQVQLHSGSDPCCCRCHLLVHEPFFCCWRSRKNGRRGGGGGFEKIGRKFLLFLIPGCVPC